MDRWMMLIFSNDDEYLINNVCVLVIECVDSVEEIC